MQGYKCRHLYMKNQILDAVKRCIVQMIAQCSFSTFSPREVHFLEIGDASTG